ncbi:Peptidase family M28 [Chitinophaga costaii]|uniref:Peptidase family M28 n=1 Tax=Chitinophaga costaii TaxID=1335309 RepID=A0A1C4AWH3_9BACT|nr:M28 family peptidase [Chitinophaga costaii]PUZ26775.1 peptidase M28 [Chitinophaga costaii]SCB98975.1 Peptidase family M28 [Chitinophaga costaii]
MKQLLTAATLLCTLSVTAQQAKNVGLSAIKIADLQRDLYALADDHFRGREAGTQDELDAAAWLAEQARQIGLQPAGDNGTYFQYFPLIRDRVSSESQIILHHKPLELWKDVIVFEPVHAQVNAPLIFLNGLQDIDTADVKGKAVILRFSPEGITNPMIKSLRRYATLIIRDRVKRLAGKGPAAIVFVSDSTASQDWARSLEYADRGTYHMDGGYFNSIIVKDIPLLWINDPSLITQDSNNQTLVANIVTDHFIYPSVNVVAKQEGSDATLKSEYVLFSGHIDHDGVRHLAPGADSIYNGADDNATVDVALLAAGRAFKKQPGRRSVLFVFHGAEERGLYGSTWFAAHPTVPKAAIVSVLNGDMIGRNNIDSAALLGVNPPHRNSKDLVSVALAANAAGPHFKLDTTWDNPQQIEGWYFRSDHLPYARAGIPSIFFTTLLHPDYHTVRDDASRINYQKLTKMTQWLYLTARTLADQDARPAVDAGFRL